MIRVTAIADALLRAAQTALHETGADIRDATKENMEPGNFFWSGLSRDAALTGPAPDAEKQRAQEEAGEHIGTIYTRLDANSGEVRVQTPWAGYAEFGTVDHEAHPAFMPAILATWPAALERHIADHVHSLP